MRKKHEMAENASPPIMYVEINGGRRCPLELGQLYLFGKHLSTKEDDTKLVFNVEDENVDEKHCCVEVSVAEDVYVFDLFSSCGTFVNGDRLKPLEKICVKHGDVMKLGTLQSVRFYHEELEVSHDSSGFGDNNKNVSDIIGSSPESTSPRHVRPKKRFHSHNSGNFLVPAVPPPPKNATRKSNSFVVPETEELSTSRTSLGLNVSQNKSRNSDSFTIPETQYCGGRASIASNLSLAETNPDEDQTKSRLSFNALGGDNINDDDFYIPETQEFVPKSEKPRSLKDNKLMNVLKTLEEKSVDLNDSDDDSLGGSQFRICTQDYNEGFGEEDNNSMLHSQVIPLIKHTTVLLNDSSVMRTPVKEPQIDLSARESRQAAQEVDKEIAKINWSADQADDGEEVKNLTDCSTPDLFEFEALETAQVDAANNDEGNLFVQNPPPLEDGEDFMPTQLFPASSNRKQNVKYKGKLIKEKDICCGEDDEQFLTLSDKENMHPDRLEPITDLPPTQLFATNEAPSERSLASTSSRKSNLSKTDARLNETPTTSTKDTSVLPHVTSDEEDDILTQAFVQSAPKQRATDTKTTSIHNYFNSTLLDDRAVNRNPTSFFAEMEKTPTKVQTGIDSSNNFKIPEKEYTAVKKSASAVSTTSTATVGSECSDMELLMCTPQFIKDHMQFSKADELKKHILAAKNKKLFGEDTDDGDDSDDDGKSKDMCLVELINVPKDSTDFDKLLPHLKHDKDGRLKRKSLLTEEQKAAKEAGKKYKFNISFGQEQEKDQKTGTSNSSTRSRDERHAARDKEKDMSSDKQPKTSRRAKHVETNTTIKPETKSTTTRKTRGKDDQSDEKKIEMEVRPSSKQESIKEKKSEKEEPSKRHQKPARATGKNSDAVKKSAKTTKSNEKCVEPQQKKESHNKANKTEEDSSSKEERSTRRRTRLQSADKPKEKSDEKETKAPARRITRLKSATEDKEKSSSKKGSIAASDDIDLIPTQPLIHNTRTRTRTSSRSTHKDTSYESDASLSSHTSTNTSRSLNRTSSRLNTSHSAALIPDSTAKTTPASSSLSAPERKRKADVPMPPQVDERKRLKRTISQDSTIPTPSVSTATTKHLISITMVDPERFNELNAKSNGLWAVAKDPVDSKILVMDKSFRTFKFLLALARGIPIVNSQWLRDLNAAKSLKKAPGIAKYMFSDPTFEKKHKFSLEKSLQLARDNKKGVFHGHEFLMTANIKPSPAEIRAIIENSGGIVHVKGPTAAAKNQKIYLVSSTDDCKDWHKYRRLNANIVIVNTEAIMSAVMRQNCTPLLNHILA